MVEVKVWQLTERSPNLDTSPEDRPKVRKIELSGMKQENQKSKRNYYKRTKKEPLKKK